MAANVVEMPKTFEQTENESMLRLCARIKTNRHFKDALLYAPAHQRRKMYTDMRPHMKFLVMPYTALMA